MGIKINSLWGAVISLIVSIIPEVIKRIFKDKYMKDEDREKILEYCLRECPLDKCLKESCTLFPITGGRR